MKYRVIKGNEENTVITEDGGVACIRDCEGDGYITVIDFYQDHFDSEMISRGNLWTELGEGKMYCDESNLDKDNEILVSEALDWLCPFAEKLELDESIWPGF